MVRWILSAIKQFAITELWKDSKGLWTLLGVKCDTGVKDVARSNSLLNQGVLFFRKRSTYMHESSVIYVCSETPILLALQHRKLQCHFLKLSRFKYSLPPYSVSNHSSSTLSPKHPLNASLSHCIKTCQQHRSQRQEDPAALLPRAPTRLAPRRLPAWLGILGASPRLRSWLWCAC